MTCRITDTEHFTIDASYREAAHTHSTMLAVPNDRDIKDPHILKLQKEVVKGMFHTCEWAIIYCKEDGLCYRTNGKHTSTMFADETFVWEGDIVITYVTWECDTKVELAKIYACYDRNWVKRTDSEINSGFTANVSTLHKANRKTIDDCVRGLACAKFGIGYLGHLDQEGRAEGLVSESVFCGFVRGLMEAKMVPAAKTFKRYSIIAAMYQTFQEDPIGASIFWEKVFFGSGKIRTPDRRLNTFIISTKTTDIKEETILKQNEAIINTCLREWDAWWAQYSRGMAKAGKAKRAVAYKLREARANYTKPKPEASVTRSRVTMKAKK